MPKNKKDYMQYLEENLGVTGGIDNMNVVNVSDPVEVQDVFKDPDSPILNMYSNGDGFRIHDNSHLYEVIKIFKDTTDRNPYFQSANYRIDVNNRRLVLTVITDNDHMISMEYMNGLLETMKAEIQKRYGNTFDISSEESDVMGDIGQNVGLGPSQGKKELRIIVSEKNTDKKEKPEQE